MFDALKLKKKGNKVSYVVKSTTDLVYTMVIGPSGAKQIIDKLNELNANGWDGKTHTVDVDIELTADVAVPPPNVF